MIFNSFITVNDYNFQGDYKVNSKGYPEFE